MTSTPEVVRNLLRAGGCVVVVGGRDSNLGPQLSEHPQVKILDLGNEFAEPPSNTRIIFFTRFTRHHQTERLMTWARKHRIPFDYGNTGEIRRALSLLVQHTATAIVTATEAASKEPTPVPHPTDTPHDAPQQPRGVIKKTLMNLITDFTLPALSDERLRELTKQLHDRGIKTTDESVRTYYRKMRSELGLVKRRVKKETVDAMLPPINRILPSKPRTTDVDQVRSLLNDIRGAVELIEVWLQETQDKLEQIERLKSILK